MCIELSIVAAHWKAFKRRHGSIAREISLLVLSVGAVMSAHSDQSQVEWMKQAADYKTLRQIAEAHTDALGIASLDDRDMAKWVKTICFIEITE